MFEKLFMSCGQEVENGFMCQETVDAGLVGSQKDLAKRKEQGLKGDVLGRYVRAGGTTGSVTDLSGPGASQTKTKRANAVGAASGLANQGGKAMPGSGGGLPGFGQKSAASLGLPKFGKKTRDTATGNQRSLNKAQGQNKDYGVKPGVKAVRKKK